MTIARQQDPDRRIDIAVKDAKRALDHSVGEADHAESGEVRALLAQVDVIRLVQYNWCWRCPEDTLTAPAFHQLRVRTDASHRLAVPARPALRVVEVMS